MATYIKTLKEDNGDITYPQTTADAVLNANSSTQGGTVQAFLDKAVTAEEIAVTSAITPLVTSSMIDWSTMQPTVTTQTTAATTMFAPTWYKRTYPDGRVIWSTTCKSPTYAFGAGPSWGYAQLNLPITFNSAKMTAAISVRVTDAAVAIAGVISDNTSSVDYSWNNNYGGTVNTTVNTNVVITVYPS